MENKLSTEELKDVISLGLDLTDCGYLIAKDGRLDFGDIGHLWSVVEKLGPALVGMNKIPAELKDLTAEECEELIDFIVTELQTPEDVSKVILEKILRAAKGCYEAYLAIKG